MQKSTKIKLEYYYYYYYYYYYFDAGTQFPGNGERMLAMQQREVEKSTDQRVVAQLEVCVVAVDGISGRQVERGDVDLDVLTRWRVDRPPTPIARL